MNKFVARGKDGRPIFGMVLEPGNLEKLKQGSPILEHIDSWFPNGIPRKLDLLIMHSETPIADGRKIAEMSDVTLDERTPRQKTIRPHCPECKSTVEQLGLSKGDESPVATIFCAQCGCALGILPESAITSLLPKKEPADGG